MWQLSRETWALSQDQLGVHHHLSSIVYHGGAVGFGPAGIPLTFVSVGCNNRRHFFFCHLAALKESACTMEPTKSNRKPAPRLLRILLGSAKSESQQPTKQQWWIQIFRKISPTTVMLLSLSLWRYIRTHLSDSTEPKCMNPSWSEQLCH